MAFKARKPGSTCPACNTEIHADPLGENGDEIWWSRKDPQFIGKTYHLRCRPDGKGNSPKVEKAPISVKNDALEGDMSVPKDAGHTTAYPKTPSPAVINPSVIPLTNTSEASILQTLASALNPLMDAQIKDLDERITTAVELALYDLKQNVKTVTNTVIVKDGVTVGTVTGTQHHLFPLLMQMISLRQSCYLWGEAGSGKSTAAFNASTALGLPFYYLGLQAQTTESKLMGYMDATGNYVESDFFKAYVQGGVFLLDELELGNGNLLGSLNGALANGRASFPCGIQQRHPDFVCIATGNTPALGATPAYSDRRALDGAVRDRFAFIHWNTDLVLERDAALAEYGEASEWVQWVQSVRITAATYSPRLIVTQRASVQGAKLIGAGVPVATVADMLVFRGFDSASVSQILRNNPLPIYKVGA